MARGRRERLQKRMEMYDGGEISGRKGPGGVQTEEESVVS